MVLIDSLLGLESLVIEFLTDPFVILILSYIVCVEFFRHRRRVSRLAIQHDVLLLVESLVHLAAAALGFGHLARSDKQLLLELLNLSVA